MSIDYLTFRKFAESVRESAEETKPRDSGAKGIAKAVGLGALGFGAGTGAGLLAGYGADALSRKITGKGIPRSALVAAAPLLGGAAGIAYTVHKAKEREAIQRALKNSSDN